MAGLILDTPAKHIYIGDGTTRVYPIPTYIQGDDWIRIEIDGVYVVDRRSYDIVNNSIIFVTAPGLNTQVSVQVATSIEALSQLGNSTNVDTVAGSINNVNTTATNIDNVNTTATNINNVNTVAGSINNVNTVAGSINNVNTVAGNINNVNTVAGNISKVNTVATNIVGINQIVDSLPEILSADESASTATTKASEASASATSASTSATSANTSASQALTSRNQAETFKNSASTSASTATTKASEASASATSASTSASQASASATSASTSASQASASATSASTSASQALTSRNQAETFAQQAQASASSVDANNIVHRTGDESIGGVKTFISSPVVPTPTTGTQAVNKDYVDNSINSVIIDGSKGAYGLEWNQETDIYKLIGATDRTQIQRNMKRCVLNANGTVNYFLDEYDSTKKADGTPAVLNGTDGNVMVQVPKFWYKHELNGNQHRWQVSPTAVEGFSVHPWFLEGGVEHDYRYYRAYEGIVQSGVLKSISGVTPTRNQTIVTFRTQARANGAGWNLCSWNAVNAIQILFLTEYGTFNSQSVLGSGNDSGDDYGMTTGQSNVIGNASSGKLNNNTWMSYRGIENFYGDCWEFVDGINVQNYKVFLNQNPNTFASDVFTGDYIDSGITVPAASASYVKKVSGNFIPTALGGSSSTYITDGFWSNTGNRIAFFGGSAYNGALDGAFCLRVDYVSSSVHVDVGAGLSR